MTNQNSTQNGGCNDSRKLNHTSPDGKWKSFATVPGLMQYIPSGQYFARQKVNGIVKRASLDTDVFSTAKDRLARKRKELKTPPPPPADLGTFAASRLGYLADVAANHSLAEPTKLYWNNRVAALIKSWPELDGMKLSAITLEQCRTWGAAFAEKFDTCNFNNTLSALRSILERGGLGTDKKTNPAYALKRLGNKPKELELPEPGQFKNLVLSIAGAGGRESKNCADLVEFLAYSGCRISESRLAVWADVDFNRSELKIRCAKRSKTSGASGVRFIPLNGALRQLLERLAKDTNPLPQNRICAVSECEKSLTNACKRLGIARLTHHSLRHFYASVCIESGVDIPTVSRWLGHLDGGALAMRIYGHLRRSHSQGMAAKVEFKALPEPIPEPVGCFAESI
jgi:integrase